MIRSPTFLQISRESAAVIKTCSLPSSFCSRFVVSLRPDSISEIAQSLGYESANAFTKAFKKIMDCLLRRYNRGQNLVSLRIAKEKQPQPMGPTVGRVQRELYS